MALNFFKDIQEKQNLLDKRIQELEEKLKNETTNAPQSASPVTLPTTAAVLEGFGPTKRILKPDAVPTKFCFTPATKRRRVSEVRRARAEQQDIIKELTTTPVLSGPYVSTSDTEMIVTSIEPTTKDVGIQCG